MHPSTEQLRLYSTGNASQEVLDSIEEHVNECSECGRAIVLIVRQFMQPGAERCGPVISF